MEIYTHIQIIGNAWIPEMFYVRNLLTTAEYEAMKDDHEGFIRLIEEGERYLSKEQREAIKRSNEALKNALTN